MRSTVLLALSLATVAAVPRQEQKIVGGSETTIDQYPSIAALLYTANYVFYEQACGGVIINARSVLTAAHCVVGDGANRWRIRIGSSYANSGGVVHSVQSIVLHHGYYTWTSDNDIAMMRTVSVITYSNNVQAARIAGGSYNVGDNGIVWAAGWGHTSGTHSEQLNHVEILIINQAICKERYASIGQGVTDNMLCAGYIVVGGRGQCQLDHGGPLYHNGIVVGVSSWGEGCGLAEYPGVNVRVSRYTAWIQAYA